MKKILITGADSYIGTSVEKWLNRPEFVGKYQVDTIDMRGNTWKRKDFTGYDTVFHVAGIVHQKEKRKNINLYYKINRDLAIETAVKARNEGIQQFIFLSSMSVYGMQEGIIRKDVLPQPQSHYGKSKFQAECEIQKLRSSGFQIAILRPPMVYGKGCKGNYQRLRKIALHIPVFPDMSNQRSMLFIDNLSIFVKKIIDNNVSGIYFPQDAEYINTSNMVVEIAKHNGKKIKLTKKFNFLIRIGLLLKVPILEKAFGDLTYEKVDIVSKNTFNEIIKKIESITEE